MRVENPSIVVWRAEQPVLWRAGAIAAEVVTSETVLPETVVVGLPSDDVRTTLLAVSPEEIERLRLMSTALEHGALR